MEMSVIGPEGAGRFLISLSASGDNKIRRPSTSAQVDKSGPNDSGGQSESLPSSVDFPLRSIDSNCWSSIMEKLLTTGEKSDLAFMCHQGEKRRIYHLHKFAFILRCPGFAAYFQKLESEHLLRQIQDDENMRPKIITTLQYAAIEIDTMDSDPDNFQYLAEFVYLHKFANEEGMSDLVLKRLQGVKDHFQPAGMAEECARILELRLNPPTPSTVIDVDTSSGSSPNNNSDQVQMEIIDIVDVDVQGQENENASNINPEAKAKAESAHLNPVCKIEVVDIDIESDPEPVEPEPVPEDVDVKVKRKIKIRFSEMDQEADGQWQVRLPKLTARKVKKLIAEIKVEGGSAPPTPRRTASTSKSSSSTSTCSSITEVQPIRSSLSSARARVISSSSSSSCEVVSSSSDSSVVTCDSDASDWEQWQRGRTVNSRNRRKHESAEFQAMWHSSLVYKRKLRSNCKGSCCQKAKEQEQPLADRLRRRSCRSVVAVSRRTVLRRR